VLAGRYRLVRPLAGTGTGQLWNAHDEVLERAVAVRLLTTDDAEVLAAARQAGRLATPGIARVYDAAHETLPTGAAVSYVVGEWVEGTALSSLLADGPLEPARAAAVIAAAARALATAHAAGVVHGRLHPGNVVVTANGGVTLTDVGLYGGGRAEVSDQEDARALGATLYAALTGCWPLPDVPGGSTPLPPAPCHDNGQVYSPGEVRGRIPRGLDYVVSRSLETNPELPSLRSATEIAAALAPLAVGTPEEIPPAGGMSPHRAARSWLTASVVALVLAGVLAYAVVAALGTSSAHSRPPAFHDGGGRAPVRLVPVPVTAARSFNPEGTGPEDPAGVALSYDNKPGTAWVTEIYANRNFGNLKHGTGVVYDLGTPTSIREIVLTFLQPGQGVSVRAAASAASSPAGYAVVYSTSAAGTTLVVHTRHTARYWLIWLTRLPAGGPGGYQGDIAGVRFLR
jgi:tRNA A-37 threonylcarbamoyl transferase component Bud32